MQFGLPVFPDTGMLRHRRSAVSKYFDDLRYFLPTPNAHGHLNLFK